MKTPEGSSKAEAAVATCRYLLNMFNDAAAQRKIAPLDESRIAAYVFENHAEALILLYGFAEEWKQISKVPPRPEDQVA